MPNDNRSRAGLLAAGCLAAGLVLLVIRLRAVPQMGDDPGVFKTVDALFTALTSCDERRLADCERRLHEYRDAGRLPAKAASRLDAVIEDAKSHRWERAARTLYDFILQQRR